MKKRIISMVLIVSMIYMLLPSINVFVYANNENIYTLTSKLAEGDEVVIVNPSSGYAIENGNYDDYYMPAYMVNIKNNNSISINVDDNKIVWTVHIDDQGYYSFTQGEDAITAWKSGYHCNLTNNASHEQGDKKWKLTLTNEKDRIFNISSNSVTGYNEATGYIEYYTKSVNGEKVPRIAIYGANDLSEPAFGFQFYVKSTHKVTAKLAGELKDGGKYVIYFDQDELCLDENLGGVKNDVSGDFMMLPLAEGTRVFTAHINDENQIDFVSEDGRHLTSKLGGNGLSLTDELDPDGCSLWTLVAVNGGWHVMNVGANYNGNHNQALEYYNGKFTTYGVKDTGAYLFNFYELAETEAPAIMKPEWYDFFRDSYSFENYSAVIDYEYFKTLYGNGKGKAFDLWWKKHYQSGVCFGMTYTTAALINGYPKCDNIRSLINYHADPDVFDYFGVSSTVKIGNKTISISDYINYAHIYQWSSEFSNNVNQVDADTLYNRIKTCLENDQIKIAILMTKRDKSSAHAVLAVGIEGNDILIDDPNNSEGFERISRGDYGSWEYSRNSGWNNITCSLSYSTDYNTPYLLISSGTTVGAKTSTASSSGQSEQNTYVYGMEHLDSDKLLLSVDCKSYNVDTSYLTKIIPCDYENESDPNTTLFWVEDNQSVTLSAKEGKDNNFSLAGNASIVQAHTSDSSEVTLAIDEEDYVFASINSTTGNDYGIDIITFDDENNSHEIAIIGTAEENVITATQKESGIIINGLSNITATLLDGENNVVSAASVVDSEGETFNIIVNNDTSEVVIESISEHSIVTGFCGAVENDPDAMSDALKWMLDRNTGVLTISGSGAMKDFEYSSEINAPTPTVPWHEYESEIQSIFLTNGITHIGNYAFKNCTKATKVTIPKTVESIGEASFDSCRALKSISIPNGVKIIEDFAFCSCSALESVTLPNSLTAIGNLAFAFCRSLNGITIPYGVAEIGINAYHGCTSLAEVKISDGVNVIKASAFSECSSLTSASIPSSVSYVGKAVFEKCSSLSQIVIQSRECYIFDDENTLGVPGITTIYGACSSTAETYSNKFGYVFKPLCDMYGHMYLLQLVEATCTEQGYTHTWCVYCGDNKNYDYTPALGHEYSSVITNPTCTEKGYTTYSCWRCGDSYVSNEIKELGHSFVNGICTRCGIKDSNYKPDDTTQTENPFADVKENDWFKTAVLWAVSQNPPITNGTDNTHFSPYKTCTRAEVVQFLYNAAGKPVFIGVKPNTFVDVKIYDWFRTAVIWAAENGITTGTDTTHFSPTKTCTRAEVVQFLYNAAGKPEPKSRTNPFKDVSSSDWYYDAVLWAVGEGITSGVDATHFAPNKTCTRAEVVQFLYMSKQ